VNDIREKVDLTKSDLADGAKEPFVFKWVRLFYDDLDKGF